MWIVNTPLCKQLKNKVCVSSACGKPEYDLISCVGWDGWDTCQVFRDRAGKLRWSNTGSSVNLTIEHTSVKKEAPPEFESELDGPKDLEVSDLDDVGGIFKGGKRRELDGIV